MPTALVIRTAGTNCDAEMARAFALAGAEAKVLHLDRLIADPAPIESADLIGLPGGFSYGDDVASGRIFALRLRQYLYPALRNAVGRGCPVIAVCNGFQVAVQAGLLPGWGDEATAADAPMTPGASRPEQQVALCHNTGGRFIDHWVRIEPDPASVCLWTAGLAEAFHERASEALLLPMAHGEGRLVARPEVLSRLSSQGQIALRYAPEDNLNGSSDRIAGICDPTGRVFGLMPHPERYLDWTRHPFWTRLSPSIRQGDPPGLVMFRNAVESLRQPVQSGDRMA
jgi:phosphoribosylformylglycinamidine synthase I